MKPGDEWGEPTGATANLVVTGDDADLAAALATAPPDPLVEFHPRASELAQTIGLSDTQRAEPAGLALPMDLLTTPVGSSVNGVIFGVGPGRLHWWTRRSPVRVVVDGRERWSGPAVTVVVANGQFLDGANLVPRSHPGDGRLDIQVYALEPGERAAVRRRLASGTHLPHPRITTTSGRSVTIEAVGRPWPVRIDGRPVGRRSDLRIDLVGAAYRLLI